MTLLQDFERMVNEADKYFADAINEDILRWAMEGPLFGPPKPIMGPSDYANDPRYYLDMGFPHCWMPKEGCMDDIAKNPYKYYLGES